MLNSGILCRFKHSSAAERVQLDKENQKKRKKISKKKKNWENIARVKPDPKQMNREKTLAGIARRSVLHGFLYILL